MTIGEILRFYKRADVIEARGDIGACAGCSKHFDVGEHLSIYTLVATNPEYTRPGGILLCKNCTHLVMTTPVPVD